VSNARPVSEDWHPFRGGFRFLVIFSLDAVFTVASLYLAYLIRFEWKVPPAEASGFLHALPLLVAARLALNFVFGVHRWSFRMSGFYEALRLAAATLSATACFVAVYYFFQKFGPPRSVIALEYFFTTTAMAAFRFSPRLASNWFVDQRRMRRRGSLRTVIVGAGSAGDLLLRDLLRSDEHVYDVVGFVDDDPRKKGMRLGGKPVLGVLDALPEIVDRFSISQVLIAIPRLASEKIRKILEICANFKLQFKIIPVSFAYLNDRIAASMLHDLSPEDLLPRDEAAIDTEEIRSLISGRRVLVTGAAGSIGGEIARQAAAFGVESLTLVDINENDLYFLYRDLRERHPDLKVVAEIADIRDGPRMHRVGELYRPGCVFHAAAHKHVPLMEDTPEEAVKNNVFGTWNVAAMADACGAERFVLISTDKAVRPSSVMGATKRVAELLVRSLAHSSTTRFTAVRFGNVLGSAGSVVPLFRRQIERGGPVTVTHPECSRYFMTISEAVGLVLMAGLSDYGELCLLDMGAPMRIIDLASLMITMAGLVPDAEIKIEFTGLRPGEKLSEELILEEEERSSIVRNKIFRVESPSPSSDLLDRLEDLREATGASDREAIRRILKDLVPTFESPQATSRPLVRQDPPGGVRLDRTH
jgi:FlaA1/EpsC-like NDP-sugar epimerase